MSNTRMGTVNLLVSAQNGGVVLKNGTGGGAPALQEVAPYTMSNLLHHDRYSEWKIPSLGAGLFNVDFDMGADQTFSTAAVMNFRRISGTGPFVDVYTQTGAYTPGGVWTFRGSVANLGALTDDWVDFSPVTARSVRFTFSLIDTAQFVAGVLYVGTLSDMGGVYSRGGSRTLFKNRSEQQLPSGVYMINGLGNDGAIFSFPWEKIPAAGRGVLLTAQTANFPIIFIDEAPHVYQVIMREGRLTDALVFGTLYDMTCEFARLP